MKLLFLFLFACMGLAFDISSEEVKRSFSFPQLIETETIEEVMKEVQPHTFVFIDIDDTLIDFETHLGCKRWRTRIKNSPLKEYHDLFTLYIAKHIQMSAVDPKMPEWVQELQAKGHFLFPLTARERDCWYDLQGVSGVDELTYQALLSAGMDFAKTSSPFYVSYMNQEHFYGGIYFSKHPLEGEKTKGETVQDILSPLLALPHDHRPSIEVFIIDDKKEQCESVIAALNQVGIPCKGYWYRAAEKNHLEFDFAISLIQLDALLFDQEVLSNQEASEQLKLRGPIEEKELIEEILRRFFKESACSLGEYNPQFLPDSSLLPNLFPLFVK